MNVFTPSPVTRPSYLEVAQVAELWGDVSRHRFVSGHADAVQGQFRHSNAGRSTGYCRVFRARVARLASYCWHRGVPLAFVCRIRVPHGAGARYLLRLVNTAITVGVGIGKKFHCL